MKGKLTEKQFNKMLEDAFESCVMEEVKVEHFYLTSGFTAKPHSGRHTCLRWGYWCWRNLFEYPQDLLVYLRRKLTTRGKS